MKIESLDVYHEPDDRLNRAEYQQRDVMAAFPETPAETGDQDARDDRDENESGDVVSEGHEGAADRSRRKQMAEQADDE